MADKSTRIRCVMQQPPNPPQRAVLIKSESGNKVKLYIGEVITKGGFSKVFEGELGPEKIPVAVKEIQEGPLLRLPRSLRKYLKSSRKYYEEFKAKILSPKPSKLATDAQPPSEANLQDISKKTVPLWLSRSEIKKEIESLRHFQENQFVIDLHGTSDFFSKTWIVTELCMGDAFSVVKTMARNLIVDPEEHESLIIHLMAPILSALLFLHEEGYIHRDIKPNNILVNLSGIPKLIDFGLCAELSPESGTFTSKHGSGSPYFMSPEAVRCVPMGAKSDAFSFAATACNLRTLVDPASLYSPDWNDWDVVVERYKNTSEENEEDYDKMRDFMVEFVKGTFSDTEIFLANDPWQMIGDDLAKLIVVDVDERGTLEQLAQNQIFKQEIEDWNKYLSIESDFSESFREQRTFISNAFRHHGLETSAIF